MIAAIIVIQEMKSGGMSVEQIPITDHKLATSGEKITAVIFDIANRIAGEFVSRHGGKKGTMIEGKDIEEHVSKVLESEHLLNFRKAMKDAGYDIP